MHCSLTFYLSFSCYLLYILKTLQNKLIFFLTFIKNIYFLTFFYNTHYYYTVYKLFILRSNYFFYSLILDFAEQFSTYAFNTCLAHSAVVNTLDNVHRECLGMLSLRGLVTTSKRPMKIDEFSSMQDHAIKTFARRLNEWSEKTAMLMKEGLVR